MQKTILQQGQQNFEPIANTNNSFGFKEMERTRFSASSNSSPYNLSTDQLDSKQFPEYNSLLCMGDRMTSFDLMKPGLMLSPNFKEYSLITEAVNMSQQASQFTNAGDEQRKFEVQSTSNSLGIEKLQITSTDFNNEPSEPNEVPKHQITLDTNGDKPKLKRKYTRRVKPMLKEMEIPSDNIIRGSWTVEEDSQLAILIEENGPTKWVTIAKQLGTRTGKQCRERWHNHLDPAILKTPFTPEEDLKIVKLYNQLGAKWATMSKLMPGRPDNAIKNHFNTFLYPRRIHLKGQIKKPKPEKMEKQPKAKIPKVKKEPKPTKPKQSKLKNEKLSDAPTIKLENNATGSNTFYNSNLNNQLLPPNINNMLFHQDLNNSAYANNANNNKLATLPLHNMNPSNITNLHNLPNNTTNLNMNINTNNSQNLQPYMYPTNHFHNMYQNNIFANLNDYRDDEDMKMILNLSQDLGINLSHY